MDPVAGKHPPGAATRINRRPSLDATPFELYFHHFLDEVSI
jgi:hypothetical protein